MDRTSLNDSARKSQRTCIRVIELINAHGHENIGANHKSTFEITKDEELTERGGCIVALGASKGAIDLSDGFKKILCNNDARLTIILEANGRKEVAVGMGSKLLTLKDEKDLVVRKSDFTCDRTLMIKSGKAAIDFDRSFIDSLRNSNTEINIKLIVERTV